MKKMKNRLLALMLTLITSTTALAEVISGSCGNDATYSYDTDSEILTIGGSGKMQNYSSKSVDGKTNVTTAPWGDYYNKISTVVISDGITSIGDRAFYGCSDLSSVTIPISVTQIGTYAFGSCTGITSMDIPNSVKEIGQYAYQGCTALTSVRIPNSVTQIGAYAFDGCSELTFLVLDSLDISKGLHLGQHAFSNCTKLISVSLHDQFIVYGYWAFSGCTSLTSPIYNRDHLLYMPASCMGSYTVPENRYILGYSFEDSYGTTSVITPNDIGGIGNYAFRDCM